MNVPLPPKNTGEAPIRRLAEDPCPPPGVYLMALRAKASRFPKPAPDAPAGVQGDLETLKSPAPPADSQDSLE